MARRRDHDHARRAGAPSQRQLRVGEELRHALAQLLRPGELRDPALRDANITVTEVRISPDLKNATAFVMPLAGANTDEIMAGLKRSAPFLKARRGPHGRAAAGAEYRLCVRYRVRQRRADRGAAARARGRARPAAAARGRWQSRVSRACTAG